MFYFDIQEQAELFRQKLLIQHYSPNTFKSSLLKFLLAMLSTKLTDNLNSLRLLTTRTNLKFIANQKRLNILK